MKFVYYKKPTNSQSQQIRIFHKTNKKNKFLVNCWPSGKYVNLLYMYSILGSRGDSRIFLMGWHTGGGGGGARSSQGGPM